MEKDIFGHHGSAGRTCCKEQGDPSKIGGMPLVLEPLCLQSRAQWLPLHPSMPAPTLRLAISKKMLERNPCCREAC